MTGFEDPRGRRSEELAFSAEQAERVGAIETARALFSEAATLEEQIVADVSATAPRVRSVLATSAVALWYKARELGRALTLARHYIAAAIASDTELAELLGLIRDAWVHDKRPSTLPAHSEIARQYLETREQLDWVRQTQSGTAPRIEELDAMWKLLDDHDFTTIAQELISIDTVDRTGEFLGVDVGVEQLAQAGPRAIR